MTSCRNLVAKIRALNVFFDMIVLAARAGNRGF
jgi:hypothetical protein